MKLSITRLGAVPTALLMLAACSANVDQVSTRVRQLLDHRIRQSLPGAQGHVTVDSITLVHDQGNEYKGVASVIAYGTPLSLNLDVLTDGRNVIFDVGAPLWNQFLSSARSSEVNFLVGKLSDVVLTDAALFDVFPASLAKDKAKFAERLETIPPVEKRDGYLFGSGCKTDECTVNEAAWAIDPNTGEGAAVILETRDVKEVGTLRDFTIYAKSLEDVPPVLIEWATGEGMTDSNSVLASVGGR